MVVQYTGAMGACDSLTTKAGLSKYPPGSPERQAQVTACMAKAKKRKIKKAATTTTTTVPKAGSLKSNDPNWKLIGKAVSGDF